MKLGQLLKGKSNNNRNAVLDYANELHKFNTIDNLEELEGLDFNNDFDVEERQQIKEILSKSYSRYTPFYIYDFEIKNGSTLIELENEIKSWIYKDSTIKKSRKNEIDDCVKIDDRFNFKNFKIQNIKNKMSVKFTVEEYSKDLDMDGEYIRGNIKQKEDVTIYFFVEEKMLLINTGKEIFATLVYNKFLINNFIEYIKINPIKISNNSLNNITLDNIEEDKMTIFMLELITKRIQNSFIKVNDYLKVGICASGTKKIKSMSIRGNELLNQRDIAEKISEGFFLKNAELELQFIENIDKVDIIQIGITIQSTLKIVIMKGNNNKNNFELLKCIRESVNECCTEKIKITNIMSQYFSSVKSMEKIRNEEIINQINMELMQDDELNPNKEKIIKLIRGILCA